MSRHPYDGLGADRRHLIYPGARAFDAKAGLSLARTQKVRPALLGGAGFFATDFNRAKQSDPGAVFHATYSGGGPPARAFAAKNSSGALTDEHRVFIRFGRALNAARRIAIRYGILLASNDGTTPAIVNALGGPTLQFFRIYSDWDPAALTWNNAPLDLGAASPVETISAQIGTLDGGRVYRSPFPIHHVSSSDWSGAYGIGVRMLLALDAPSDGTVWMEAGDFNEVFAAL